MTKQQTTDEAVKVLDQTPIHVDVYNAIVEELLQSGEVHMETSKED